MIRVLEAITPSRVGGAEVYVADLCEGLAGMGAGVELFCPSGRPFVEYAAGRGLGCTTWRTHGKVDPFTVVRLAKLIKSTRSDVIHTHLSTASLLGAFAARLAGVPSVAHVHGLNSATCFRHSDVVIAVSEAARQHLVAQGLPQEKTRVVHNGVDLIKFRPMPKSAARNEAGVESDARLIGVFGRLSPEKGQRVALEAMALVARTLTNAKMLIMGDGADRAELASLAASLGISDRVRFEPFNADIRAIMSTCDVVLVPSLKEGFGLVAVNAMALERPVVATTAGGLPEIVLDGETGLLVSVGDVNAMAQALTGLLHDQSRMESMGRHGRKRVEQSFDLNMQISRVVDVLKEITELNGSRS